MKYRNISLDFEIASVSRERTNSENEPVIDETPGDISGEDGRYGFSKSWAWTCKIGDPENGDEALYPVTLYVSADDNATLSFAGTSISSSYDREIGGPRPAEITVDLKAGIYKAGLSYTNIDYKPPEGNVAILDFSISCNGTPIPPIEIIPEDNEPPAPNPDPCECPDETNPDAGGEPGISAESRSREVNSGTESFENSSSAGKNTSLIANENLMLWGTDFGKFRGMAGVPAGRLEILAYEFSQNLSSPQMLEWNHPINSWLVFDGNAISPNSQVKVFCGNAYSSWICDGTGTQFFPIGTSSNATGTLKFSSNGNEVVFTNPDRSEIHFSAQTGEFLAYKTSTGKLWTATELTQFSEIIRDANGVLLQIFNAWDGLMSVENVTGTGYEIALYLPEQIGEKSAGTGIYSVSGTPFKRFTISLSGTGKFSAIEQSSRLGAMAFPRNAWFENGVWNASIGSGTEEIVTRRERENLDENRFKITTEKYFAHDEIPASFVEEIFEENAKLGNVLVSTETFLGVDLSLKTRYFYDSRGNAIREIRPDGSEILTTFDLQNRISARYEPFAGARNKTTFFEYVSGTTNSNKLAKISETISLDNGPMDFEITNFSYEDFDEWTRETRTISVLNGGNARLEISEKFRGNATNIFARGRVKMAQNVNGVQTHYSYAGTTEHGALYKITEETKVSGSLVDGKSTKTVRYISSEGNEVFIEKFVRDNAGTWQLISTIEREFDSSNNWTKETRGNGRISQREVVCAGTLWEIDENGVRTDFVYNSAQFLTEKTRAITPTNPERTTIFDRDALGNVIRETLKLNSVDFSTKSWEFDLGGNVISQTDELGRVTEFSRTFGNSCEILTEFLPNGATKITKTFADGTLLAESGTAVRATEIEIDFLETGIRKTQKIEGTTGDSGILQREISNGFAEVVQIDQPNTLGGFVTTTQNFNKLGQMIRRQRGNAAPEIFEYDSFGNLSKKTLALTENPTPTNSPITEISTNFVTRGNAVYEEVATTNYNTAGTPIVKSTGTLISESATLENQTFETDFRGNETIRWTEFGTGTARTQKIQIPTATNLEIIEIVDGFTVSQTDFAGTQTQFSRQFRTGENAGILLTKIDGRGNATTTEQNVLGWNLKITDAANNSTEFGYFLGNGKIAFIKNALGNFQRFEYDLHGNAIAEFGTGTLPILREFDDANHMISQTLFRVPAEEISTNPEERTDGDTTRWIVDAQTGLEIQKIYPDGNTNSKTYNAENQLATTTDARGNVKTFSYNSLTGTLASITYSDGTASEIFVQNFLGNEISRADAFGITTFDYNEFNELCGENLAGLFTKTITYHRDNFGRNAGYSIDNERKTEIEYDATTGRIVGLAAGTQNFAWEYLAGTTNLKSKLTYPNGATAEWHYETARDLLAQVKNTVGGNVISQFDYANNALGLRERVEKSGTLAISAGTQNFAYNARNELTGTTDFAANFDNCGNRISATLAGTPINYSTNDLNQYTMETMFAPSYDADGNATALKNATGTWAIAYNGANRATTWQKSTGEKVFMIYDALGRRFEKRVLNTAGTRIFRERYVYVGYNCVQVLNGDNGNAVTKEFVWEPAGIAGTDFAGTRSPLAFKFVSRGLNLFYAVDGNKNISDLFFFALQNGVALHYEYSPFGLLAGTSKSTTSTVDFLTENPFRFSSQFFDSELDLIYYNYRHYSPLLGRFLSRDPLFDRGGANLYAFCGNDPINKTDFLGFYSQLKPCSEYPRWIIGSDGITYKGLAGEKNPNKTTNGCGDDSIWGRIVPNTPWPALLWRVTFKTACDNHDICYASCGIENDKPNCDKIFRDEMKAICDSTYAQDSNSRSRCYWAADAYADVVVGYATTAYFKAQEEGCLWEECSICDCKNQ